MDGGVVQVGERLIVDQEVAGSSPASPTKRGNVILKGHVLDILPSLESDHFHAVVTSPPYWSLRKYDIPDVTWPDSWRGQLGLEPTIGLYVSHLIVVFRAVKRVLRPDGTLWVNIGDSYFGDSPVRSSSMEQFDPTKQTVLKRSAGGIRRSAASTDGLKPKDLCLIPARFALAMQEDGWWLRSDIIWAKPNPMPEAVDGWHWERHKIKVNAARRPRQCFHHSEGREISVPVSQQPKTEWTDCPGCPKCSPNDGLVLERGSWRPTNSFEHIYMFTKSPKYFCDADAVREKNADPTRTNFTAGGRSRGINKDRNDNDLGERSKNFVAAGRNLRSVWEIVTQPYREAHFATYPEEVPRRCILAGTSSRGCCPQCGSPWARVIKKSLISLRPNFDKQRGNYLSRTIGWRRTCEHDTSGIAIPCRVLDPFIGSGTTGKVAESLSRDWVGIDLGYKSMSRKRSVTTMGLAL